MLLSKSVRSGAVVALVVFGLAACGESSTAPVPVSSQISAAAVEEPLMSYASSADSDGDGDDVSANVQYGSRKFRIRPGKPMLKKLGEHRLYIPANVVCDPATSGYGSSFWNQSCQTVNREIEVTAQWATVNGRTAFRFKPDLRFVPSTDRSRWVVISTKHSNGIDPAAYYTLLWRDPATKQWIDEAASDPTLRAQVDKRGKTVSRRLKHFSDYWLWVGLGSYNVTSGMGGDGGDDLWWNW